MTTIQAAELRKNMDSYLKRASKGEEFKVTYRGKSVAVLSADKDNNQPSNSAALFAAAAKIRASIPADKLLELQKKTDQQIKDEYNDYRMSKYGI